VFGILVPNIIKAGIIIFNLFLMRLVDMFINVKMYKCATPPKLISAQPPGQKIKKKLSYFQTNQK